MQQLFPSLFPPDQPILAHLTTSAHHIILSRLQALKREGISHVVQLEQWLMEGAYNKVACTSA